MRTLVLKIDVDSYQGTLEGIPRLLHCLQRHNLPATFFPTLGHDTHGRSLPQLIRTHALPFFKRSPRAPLFEEYSGKTLCYGTILPAPDIGLRCATLLQHIDRAGYEIGLHPWNTDQWIRHIEANITLKYINDSIKRSIERFTLLFKRPPSLFAAPSWKTHPQALRSTHQQGITGCSDTRGQHPYLPIIEGQTILCPQLPTTLPSLNELLLREGRDINRISQELLDYTYHAPTCGHVYTLHAEHEGGKLLYPFEQLIEGWKKQGYRFITLGEFSALAQRHAGGLLSLPRHAIQFNSESQQGMAYRI